MMNCKILTSSKEVNKDKWLNFVKSHPHGNIFQTYYMYEIYNSTRNHEPIFIAVTDDNGNILGILLGVIQKEYSNFFGYFTSRSIVIGGPLVKDDDKNIMKIILNQYSMHIRRKVIYSQIRNLHDQLIFNDSFQSAGFRFESHLNYIINLNKGKDYVWSRIHKSKRKKIKKCINSGLESNVYDGNIGEEILNKGYNILKEVYHNAKLPIPDISLIQNANKENILLVFTSEYKGEIIGCRFALRYNKSIYGWFAGSYSKYYHLYSNDFLIWKTLEWGIVNEYNYFDYGGAGSPNKPYGVRKFKSQLGGELVNYGRYICEYKPLMMLLGKIGLKVWQKVKI